MTANATPLLLPRALEPGGTISVLSIASPSSPERIEPAAEALRARGYDVRVGSNTYERVRGYLAGEDDIRLAALNDALRDTAVDAIFFARGGYGTMRILDRIDYAAIARDPKPVVGYSDVTALHQAMAARSGVGSFHGPMLNTDFFEGLDPSVDRWLWSALSGGAPLEWAFDDANVVVEGTAEAPLFGGCLSITAALLGTPYDYWIDGGIWFWEDVTEPAYRIDRMLTTLRLSGRLASLRGVVIGRLRDCGSGNHGEIDALYTQFFGTLGIPVLRDMPFGHFGNNLLLPVGRSVHLDTRSRSMRITEPVVARRSR